MRWVLNQEMKQLKSLSWRHIAVFGPLSDGQVKISTPGTILNSDNKLGKPGE